jgi:hypothetical protein
LRSRSSELIVLRPVTNIVGPVGWRPNLRDLASGDPGRLSTEPAHQFSDPAVER